MGLFIWFRARKALKMLSLYKFKMSKYFHFVVCVCLGFMALGQDGDGYKAALINDTQPIFTQNLDTVKAPANYDNIYSRPLYSDSLASGFVIFIKKEVKEHKHALHSENILVLEGEAVMKIEGKSFSIKKGDMIFVPKGTWHYVKVSSNVPLKVLSVQSPNFDGKDRIFKEK